MGALSGQAVRGVDQAARPPELADQVPQPLQGRTDQGGSGVSVVLEHPLFRHVQPQLSGVSTQCRGLGSDRLLFLSVAP